jgi:hypothetical protein
VLVTLDSEILVLSVLCSKAIIVFFILSLRLTHVPPTLANRLYGL